MERKAADSIIGWKRSCTLSRCTKERVGCLQKRPTDSSTLPIWRLLQLVGSNFSSTIYCGLLLSAGHLTLNQRVGGSSPLRLIGIQHVACPVSLPSASSGKRELCYAKAEERPTDSTIPHSDLVLHETVFLVTRRPRGPSPRTFTYHKDELYLLQNFLEGVGELQSLTP